MNNRIRRTRPIRFAAIACVALVGAACSSGETATESTTSASVDDVSTTSGSNEPATTSQNGEPSESGIGEGTNAVGLTCEETAALFMTKGSANDDLVDPESRAICSDDNIIVSSNGIPDYTYIETSPGSPTPNNYEFTFPASPTKASETTDVPALGTAAIALNGVPIYGPTEGTGGDVLSLEGALSECGSHNGPTGFHIHLVGTSNTTDCIFTAEEIAGEPPLLGYAFDGYPIYVGNELYSSSWELTDESLFASDTWSAHTFVEGSGDLDECNGVSDADGNYAYYTTNTFPYVIGCYAGEVDLAAAGAGGGAGAGNPGDRPNPGA